MVREASVRRQVVAYLTGLAKSGQPVCWRSNPPSPFDGVAGDPDIIACVNGLFVVLELKKPGWHPTEAWGKTAQARRLKAWQDAGALGGIVQSREDAEVWVREAMRR